MIKKVINNVCLLLITLFYSIVTYSVIRGHPEIIPAQYAAPFPQLPGTPPITQKSIDKAIENFKIQVPWFAFHPQLNLYLFNDTLGITYPWLLGQGCAVYIGPNAFTSWGALGATLAHEVEVHCNQNHFLIFIEMIVTSDLDVITKIERQAYMYEFNSAERFHLSDAERMDIYTTMNYYYPIKD